MKRVSILQIGMLALLAVPLQAQKIEVIVEIFGNMKGETYEIRSSQFNSKFSSSSLKSYHYASLGIADSSIMKKRVSSLVLQKKRRWLPGFKNVKLVIPTGLDRYLIFERNRKLGLRQYFEVRWSNKTSGTEKVVMPDSLQFKTDYLFPTPTILITLGDKELNADYFRNQELPAGSIFLFGVFPQHDSSLDSMTVQIESVQTMFIRFGNSIKSQSLSRNRTFISATWPPDYDMIEGSFIKFRIVYRYMKNDTVMERGVLFKSIAF